TDLATAGAKPLAGRFFGALDEPGIGGEILNPGKAPDVVNLIEQGERENLADAGKRAQALEHLRVMLLGAAHQEELELADELVVVGDQLEIDLDALADAGVGELVGHSLPVGFVKDLAGGL